MIAGLVLSTDNNRISTAPTMGAAFLCLDTTIKQFQEFMRTDEGQTIWAVINDAWLQLSLGTIVAMYIIGDLLA